MIIIPAVDIKGGKCVRLEQGRMDRETIFSELPEEMALRWEQKGAERLHLVDLDGAVQGKAVNRDVIKRVAAAVTIPVQLGGGIRDLESIEQYINLGVESVILGTQAYREPDFVKQACAEYPGRIIVGIDSRDRYVSVEGWTEATGASAIDLGKKLERFGITAIIYTDIKSDGMKKGPNIAAIREFAQNLDIPVIAAGGIGSIQDIEDVLELEGLGVSGIIIGRALYDGFITLERAIELIKKKGSWKNRKIRKVVVDI
jgi:phosphoribosylformimino-5-aminoimidazole carboxamide ribotide isomerase